MHPSESTAAGDRRFVWIAVSALALCLSLLNAGGALAAGEHPPPGHSSDDGSSGWQHDAEEPCKDKESPPEGAPPGVTPPGEKPPEEKPPDHEAPVETPPVQTPPQTPPLQTPPMETPQPAPTAPAPEAPTPPVEEKSRGGHEVLPQENVAGGRGGQEAGLPQAGVEARSEEATLPFTGASTPVVLLLGAGCLGLGLGLRRLTAEQD